MSLGGSISPFGAKTSRPAEHKVTGTGSRNFAGESLVVLVSGAPPISTLDCWTRESRPREKQLHVWDTDMEHIQIPRELWPTLQGIAT